MIILVLLAVQEEQHMEMHSYFLSDNALVCRQSKFCKVINLEGYVLHVV